MFMKKKTEDREKKKTERKKKAERGLGEGDPGLWGPGESSALS